MISSTMMLWPSTHALLRDAMGYDSYQPSRHDGMVVNIIACTSTTLLKSPSAQSCFDPLCSTDHPHALLHEACNSARALSILLVPPALVLHICLLLLLFPIAFLLLPVLHSLALGMPLPLRLAGFPPLEMGVGALGPKVPQRHP